MNSWVCRPSDTRDLNYQLSYIPIDYIRNVMQLYRYSSDVYSFKHPFVRQFVRSHHISSFHPLARIEYTYYYHTVFKAMPKGLCQSHAIELTLVLYGVYARTNNQLGLILTRWTVLALTGAHQDFQDFYNIILHVRYLFKFQGR